jgi:hypothetical protein
MNGNNDQLNLKRNSGRWRCCGRPSSFVKIILFAILILTLTFISFTNKFSYSLHYDSANIVKALSPKYPEVALPSNKGPIIADPHLRSEVVFTGLKYPTSMAF